jgi:hypothetical protein
MTTEAIVHRAAREAFAAGLSIVPPSEDGVKRPWPDESGKWEPFKTTRATAAQMQGWWPGRTGLGVIAGPASGGVESWDFDDDDAFRAFLAAADAAGLSSGVARIRAGYEDRTPAGGVRWLVRYPADVTRGANLKLARRPKRPDERKHDHDLVKTLIELPDYAVVAPSNGKVHPSGRPYVRQSGGFPTIASYSADEREALIQLARSFDEMPRADTSRSTAPTPDRGGRPGDDFTRRVPWPDVLEPHGWRAVHTRGDVTCWRRPGKATPGISATTNHAGSDLLYVFSSSTPFEPDRGYSKFSAYALLNHGGDFAAAARDLAGHGYGEPARGVGQTTGGPDTSGQAHAETSQDGAPAHPHRWQRAGDAIAEPSPEPIVEGTAWSDCLTVLVGESASGKTFVELDMAASVSADLAWHGRGVKHGSVVYYGFEGNVSLRLRVLREVAGHRLENVYVIKASDPLSPIVDRDRVEIPGRGEQDAIRDLQEIVAHIKAGGLPPVTLTFIDTVRASLSGSEDSSEAASAYLRAVRRIMTHAPGAACILAHHAGWQDGETKRKRERGSSAFRGNVDGTLYLEAGEYDRERRQARLTLSTIKVRDGETLPPIYMVRKQVEIPGLADRWGRPVTSCIIVADPRTREDREAEGTRKAEAQTRAVDLKTLHVIAERPVLATSQEKIRVAVGLAKTVVCESVARLLERGWADPPAAQRLPYTLTPAGRAALEASPCESD